MKTKQSKKGIAIITVMMAMTILLMIAGAFLTINRDNFAQVNSSNKRDEARATCEAVYNYLLFRLEHDKFYGANTFAGATDSETGSMLKVKEVAGTHTIKGEIPSLHSTFTAKIENNLNIDATSADGVPAHAARLQIAADSTGITRNVETLVRVAPLFDSSALSRGAMNIEATDFTVSSLDDYRNMVRAEGEIKVPNVLSGFANTRFTTPDKKKADSKGMIWSKNKITAGGVDLTNHLADANTNSGGRFVPNAKQHFEIYDLKPSDLKVSSSNIAVRPGEYRFTTAKAKLTINSDLNVEKKTILGFKYNEKAGLTWTSEQDISVLEYYAKPTDTVPTRVYRSQEQIKNLPTPPVAKNVKVEKQTLQSVDIVYTNPAAANSQLPVTVQDVVYIDEDPTSQKVAVDLKGQVVKMPNDSTVTSAGDFKITTQRGTPPRIEMGNGTTAVVAEGNLNLEAGVTSGFGTLVAKNGDLSLRAESNSSITASGQQKGLVAYAGRDVNIQKPSDASASWRLNGLVYARRNFNLESNNSDMRLEGTLVAREGNINITGANAVDFIYNPKYLETMVNDLPQNRVQIEKVYWKE